MLVSMKLHEIRFYREVRKIGNCSPKYFASLDLCKCVVSIMSDCTQNRKHYSTVSDGLAMFSAPDKKW